jgi:hypothetical protein
MKLLEPDWETSGRQVKTPLLVSNVALAGALRRLKVSVWGGRSESVATLVTERETPTLMEKLASGMGATNTGGVFGGGLTVSVATPLVMELALLLTKTE